MKNQAFTLIELLVVVLIIGILAAVAVPQYRKAVEKSKAVQAIVVLKSLHQAAQAYYLANGKYPTKFEDLDVDLAAWTGTTQIHTSNVQDTKSNEEWSLQIYSANPGNAIMIMMLRITGVYKGAGFVVSGSKGAPDCVEDMASGVFPSSKEGKYCQKIFNGTVRDPENTFRRYILP